MMLMITIMVLMEMRKFAAHCNRYEDNHDGLLEK